MFILLMKTQNLKQELKGFIKTTTGMSDMKIIILLPAFMSMIRLSLTSLTIKNRYILRMEHFRANIKD